MADHITKTGAIRMLRGADLLWSVKRRLFDMRHWYEAAMNHVGKHLQNPKMHDSPHIECRSTACALGTMASDPWFRRKGLRLEITLARVQDAKYYNNPRVRGEVFYDGVAGFTAASAFFGISQDAAKSLFISNSDISMATPKQVARYLRRFVKTGELPT